MLWPFSPCYRVPSLPELRLGGQFFVPNHSSSVSTVFLQFSFKFCSTLYYCPLIIHLEKICSVVTSNRKASKPTPASLLKYQKSFLNYRSLYLYYTMVWCKLFLQTLVCGFQVFKFKCLCYLTQAMMSYTNNVTAAGASSAPMPEVSEQQIEMDKKQIYK